MNAGFALLAWLVQAPAAAPVAGVTIGATSTYRLVLLAGEPLYRVSPLARPGSYVFELISDHPPLRSRIEPTSALRPGTYNIEVTRRVDDANRSFVFTLPVQPGQFVFVITTNGKARYDFVLAGPVGPPQRTTFVAPQKRYLFRAAFARPRPPRRRH
jgi:hypothetical protein